MVSLKRQVTVGEKVNEHFQSYREEDMTNAHWLTTRIKTRLSATAQINIKHRKCFFHFTNLSRGEFCKFEDVRLKKLLS